MNYRDLQEVQATKRELYSREIHSSLTIPIAQNIFTGAMVTVVFVIISWIVSSIAGIDFLHSNGIGTIEDYIKFSLITLLFVAINFVTTMANVLSTRNKRGYGSIGINAIVAIAVVIWSVTTSFTPHAIFWSQIGVALGLLWALCLCIIAFSNEESVIAMLFYKLGRASLSGKISGLEQANLRLLRELEESNGNTDMIYSNDTYGKRKRLLSDSMVLYDAVADETRENPSKRIAQDKLNIPQDRWARGRDALRAVEAVGSNWELLNRDRSDVENKLALWIQKYIT